jgi:hypothetical protein
VVKSVRKEEIAQGMSAEVQETKAVEKNDETVRSGISRETGATASMTNVTVDGTMTGA